jgi:hypothetical protein
VSTIMRLLPICCLLLLASLANAQDDVEVVVRWGASPHQDAQGHPLSPAVRYQVYLESDGADEVTVAEVEGDTTTVVSLPLGMVHRVRVVGYDAQERASQPSEWSDPVYFDQDRGDTEIPVVPQLKPNFPNPFNPETRITYGVPESVTGGQAVTLEIYTPLGHRVRTFQVDRSPGTHEVHWDGTDDSGRIQAAGVYVTRFACGAEVQVRKMTMVK